MDIKLLDEFNKQITRELYSSYLYLGMVTYFEEVGLDGFSKWMRMQSQEELMHAMKLFDYVCERGDTVVLDTIDKPNAKYNSVEHVFEETLKHEKHVTSCINNLYAVARNVNDNAAMGFLQWFIDEQVEEEKNVGDVLAKMKFVKNQPAGILFLDKELGSRPAPTPPAE